MAIAFRRVRSSPLQEFEAAAPDGVTIGIIGNRGSGKGKLLRLATGLEKPASGSVEASGEARLLGPGDELHLAPAAVLCIDRTFALQDPPARERAAIQLDDLRRSGTTTLLACYDEELLRRLCDEVWWLRDGRLAGRGDVAEMLACYRKQVAAEVRAWGESDACAAVPARAARRRAGGSLARRDDRRERPSHHGLAQRRTGGGEDRAYKFRDAVADPVIGMMIRTRIGLNVYGTNTELEKLKLGPCSAGRDSDSIVRFPLRVVPAASIPSP